jgi:hypothetical protein
MDAMLTNLIDSVTVEVVFRTVLISSWEKGGRSAPFSRYKGEGKSFCEIAGVIAILSASILAQGIG